ncbi:unnamed protein product [Bursaphelenchus okinawaensis]|uniref:Uncharacterized protein n=1 Tax=Bursaphelenchus okinawaensis TaxID=465554 RepID=A0A811JW74_9BILA|nr:unnamed protein product [Bursaphelenchus okinawaensis]CAG9086109.1 unnamed protein product [Bursaphelenchus okinawaensis]
MKIVLIFNILTISCLAAPVNITEDTTMPFNTRHPGLILGPGPQTGSGTSAGGYYFFENFLKGTYYIRKGDVFTEDDEKNEPKSLDPKTYEGPAVFYAYHDKDDKKIHMVDYLKKTVEVIEPEHNTRGFIFAAVEPYVPFKVGELRAKEEAERKAKQSPKE